MIDAAQRMIDDFKEPYSTRESQTVAGALIIALPVVEAALELELVSGPSMADIPDADIKDLSAIGLAHRRLSKALTPWQVGDDR